ncbi:uncharacterized protein [Primulina eburnea]|uniref:uncharacterized protein n=1 Tax=Primulina eburnea TaxID=1245227 RepID=UPI003C6C99F1
MVRDIGLELQGHLVYADLIVFPRPEFDIILGMDWLTNDIVLIDFKEKISAGEAVGHGAAQILIHKGCQASLTSIISTHVVPSPSISDVPVVRYFPDVFSDDVTGLPPKRDVEFVIDLMPGTMPISKAPYRLAPFEMLELKQQIQELLDK